MELLFLIAVVFGIVSYLDLKRRITALEEKFGDALEGRAPVAEEPGPADATQTASAPSEAAPVASPVAGSAEPMSADELSTPSPTEPEQGPTWGPDSGSAPSRGGSRTGDGGRTIEQSLGTRWVVWLGGLMFALGGIFLVRYAAQEGYFGPGARIFMGGVLAIVLLAAGEYMRRAPSLAQIVNLPNIAIPPIVTAVGIIVGFATIFSAFALYDMLSPAAAFILLGLVAVASVLLAAVHGPLLGALGLVGSYATPFLVSSDEPSLVSLFAYLTFVTIALLGLVRIRRWWWLGLASLAGVTLWTLVALYAISDIGEAFVLSLYLPVTMVLFLLTPAAADLSASAKFGQPRLLTSAAVIIFGVLLVLFSLEEAYSNFALCALATYGIAAAVLAYRAPRLERELLASCGIVAFALLLWVPVGEIVFIETDAASRGSLSPPGLPAELEFYTIILSLFAAGYAIGGYAVLARVANRGLWASVSATFPLFMLATVYWRSSALETSMAWGLVAGLIALAMTGATLSLRTGSQVQTRGSDGAVGAYATAALAALALGLAMVLRDAWLTASLSLLLIGIAWIHMSLALPLLRWVALVAASIIMLRLTLNPSLADYAISQTPFFNLLIYAYAWPAAAMAATAIWMKRQKDDVVVQCLEGGAAVLLTLFVSLEIHHWLSDGDLFNPTYSFGEASLQTLTWLSLSYLYYRLGRDRGRTLLTVAGQVLRWAGLAHLLVVQVLFGNPLFTGDPVGERFFFNYLLLAYLGPCVFTLLYYRTASQRNDRPTALLFGASSLLLVLIFVTLQIRQAFHGTVLSGGDTSDLEWYSYSIVWLLIGVVFFAMSFRHSGRDLRLASMGIITIAASKGFLLDMAVLEGFLRAISFIGFGATLMGIGLLYQRFVFPPSAAAIPPDEPENP